MAETPDFSKAIKRTIFIAFLAAALYVGLTFWAGYSSMVNAISTFPVSYLFFATGLVTLNYVIRYARWDFLLYSNNIRIPHKQNFLIFLSGFALTMTPAKIGEAIKSVLLAKKGIPITDSIGAVIYERINDLIAVSILAASGIIFLGQGILATLVSFIVITAGILILSNDTATSVAMGVLKKLHVPETVLARILEIIENTRVYLPLKIQLPSLMAGITGWFFEGAAFFIICQGLNIDISLHVAVFIFAISTIAGIFFPGGLGGMEGMLLLLLKEHGNWGQIITSVILIRFVTVWWATFCGFISLSIYAFWSHTPHKNVEK
ncbi:MAG: flippase-like domain-containing protein [Deltaproteobacteria bacterium]|nr:flippase-like domain-containing protein [Deltaproteobacteria bacterium]